jgi:hypothetical protein
VSSRPLVVAAAVSTLLAAAAHAQGAVSPRCTTPLQLTDDGCQKALDLFNFLAPQLGVSITGGNAVIGNPSTLGGLGHFTVGVRANLVQGQIPQTANVELSLQGARSSDFSPTSHVVGLPTAEAAVGLFKGIGVGLTNVGGIDALVSAFYVPDVNQNGVSVGTTGGKLKLGYGARVGILQETSVVPGLVVSYLRRDLPTTQLTARIGTSDSVRVTSLSERTSAWRVAAGKRFSLLGVTAGVGRDHYDSHANALAFVGSRGVTPAIIAGFNNILAQTLTRTNVFAGASLDVAPLHVAAEIGRVSGGSVVQPFNRFGSRSPDDPYVYGSLGLRVGF